MCPVYERDGLTRVAVIRSSSSNSKYLISYKIFTRFINISVFEATAYASRSSLIALSLDTAFHCSAGRVSIAACVASGVFQGSVSIARPLVRGAKKG